ncbi:class I SAM-dependent methyltransferase [Micromonospora echinofusca]|uniref:class I SAM-dependent methyltransferase n=1 Tax=Micromonospora echinofusca TaxID=47858 RepID=UPI0033D6F0A1
MPDAIFAHPLLAPVYDAFDGDRDDLAAYLAIAGELNARMVLDVGCGTGSLAIQLAELGHPVVGVDPAEASLEVARSKDPTGKVRWIRGDATALPAIGVDLATMTGNVAQVFRTDADWVQALRGIHGALRPGGHLVFETRRPERRAWEAWADLNLEGTAFTVNRACTARHSGCEDRFADERWRHHAASTAV